MKGKVNYTNKVIKVLQELHTQFPSFGLGIHIATALSDYGDYWGISDKELAFALEKYRTQLELDAEELCSDDYIARIQKDAEDLTNILKEEEDEYDL